MQYTTRADGSRVKTHVRMDFYLRIEDKERLARLPTKRRDIIEMLRDCHDENRHGPGPEGVILENLPDCGHRAWRRLGFDLLNLLDSEKSVDIAFLHQLSRYVEDALRDMRSEA